MLKRYMSVILSTVVNLSKINKRLTKLLKELQWQKYCQFRLKETKMVQNVKRSLNLQNSTGRKQAEKNSDVQMKDTFYGKGWMTQEACYSQAGV